MRVSIRTATDRDPLGWRDLGDVVNLDYGWSNPAPRAAVDELLRGARALEALPAEELERIFFRVKNSSVRPALAQVLGADPTEIAIVRNATEALNTVLLGLPLRTVRPPVPAPTLDTLAETYERAIGPRTKLVLLTHPSNLTGQLLPVRRISTAAHCVGADVVVDGTQSCGVLADPITSFDCDYYGASAH